MGCSGSKVIDTSSQTSVYKTEKKPRSKAPQTKEKETFTVKDFFDSALTLPANHGEPYSQPPLPSHYVQQNLTFDNDNVDKEIWDTKIKVEKKAKTTNEKNKKKTNDSELPWHYRKPANRKYIEPADTTTINIEYEQNSKKKSVVVVGGLYLGSVAACADSVFDSIDVESTHSVVLLGNLFDTLSTDPFHKTPSDITEVETVLAQAEPVLASIRRLAEDVNIYYMRGSYDHDLTRVAIERLLGDKTTFIQSTNLVLTVRAGNEIYRVRLTTGQQWDFLNLHTGLTLGELLVGKPIGHYLARASTQNHSFSTSALLKPIASGIPAELSNQFLQQISKRPLQDKITSRMLLSAFQLSEAEDLIDIKCLVAEGKYISVQSILEYPYIRYLLKQHGEEKLMSMFKAMTGDYGGIANAFCEDVMISGLGDEATLSKVMTESGHDILCASTGSCSKRSDRSTMLRISYPKQGSNGKIEIVQHQPVEKTTPAAAQNGTQKKQKPQSDANGDTISVESL